MSGGFAAADRSGPAIHRALLAWLDASGLDDPAVRLHLAHAQATLDAGAPSLVIEVGLGIGEALLGDWRPLAAVTAANHALVLGLELLDDVADDALHADWQRRSGDAASDVATLAAFTMISCLPPLLLDDAGVSAGARADAARLTSLGLWGANRGQSLKLTTDVTTAPPSSVADEIAALENGAHIDLVAIYPLLAARDRVEISDDTAAALRAFVVAVGRADQLGSDISDLMSGERSRAVRNGRATQPLLRALERLAAADRARLLDLLGDRAAAGDGLAEIRALVTKAGAVTRSYLDVDRHLQRARRLLDDARVDSPTLRAVIDRLSPA